MKPTVPLLLSVFLALAPAAAAADQLPLPPDSVNLSLSAEGWVEAAKARLVVAIDSARPAAEAGELRSGVHDSLAKLVPNADWHVTAFDRSRDQTGLERWHMEAEARVPETALDGLYDRAKAQSKPGEQVSVVSIDFTPELAELETVIAELRAKIYEKAKDEIARLAGLYPDRTYRMREISFGREGGPAPVPMTMMKTARAAAPAAEAGAPADSGYAPLGVAEHVELNASVVLAAEIPKPKAP
jgi:predicted secreted protein